MERKFQSKPFYYKVKGEYALFTDPVTKGGGEKFTYQVPTYQALKGITEAIYWKPTLIYYISSVKIINKITTETKGIRTIFKDGSNDLSYYTYLKNVEYLVEVYFEWNLKYDNLKQDRQEIKHQQILLRSLEKGGRRDVFLGSRECVAEVEKITKEEYEKTKSYYEGENLNFGIMFHSFIYPNETEEKIEKLQSTFSQIQMENGEIKFIRPEECQIKNELGNYTISEFEYDKNMKNIDKEILDYKKEGEINECSDIIV